ncbi:DNA (cytosine-5-)-methyltransferase [Paenibacillus sp. FSL A5-0031]|uniref:DNA (cytosine-5-)-methyltransferase n=1 Tax=Paenibacillus sp. FSL A5-0031 TaxID=1920420 RepID=UPI0009FB0FD6|nr:DNA (cytosine-5-)-methyltransferase [Paenibacillus sp. FSL A5-0031]
MWSAYDVRSVTDDHIRLLGRERGPIQGIVAVFPCQAFSIAGKREGFNDAIRGTVFFEIIRFASILKPEFILLENVTGLLSHDKGRTFETIIGTLDELGYVGEWCVLNSSAYVPQNRERVFTVASLRGSSGEKIFPFREENNKPAKDSKTIASKVMIAGNVNPSGRGMNGQVISANGLAPTLTTNKGEGNKILVNVSQKTGVNETGEAACLDASYFKGLGANQARTGVMEPMAVLTPDREEKRQNGRRFKELGEPSFTLTAQDKHGIYDGYRIRKLTPLECFRLQSFPDDWFYTLKGYGISDSQLYKMAGNAVTSRVAYEIGKRLMDSFSI